MMKTAKIIELDETNICKICENQLGKYTCPKCNILYCTLTCYKSEKHAQCSETFYRDCIMEELKTDDSTSDSKEKMIEILKRFNEETKEETNEENFEIDSDDEEDQPDLAERLENIDLNDATTVWNLLTQDEQQEFEAIVTSSDISKLLPEWKPWWDFKTDTKLIQELTKEKPNQDYRKLCPSLFENVAKFEEISKHKPAEAVKYNLLNLIGAYTCITRYYNGDHIEFVREAVYLISNLSKNLESNACFESYTLALESVYQQALINEWMSVDTDIKTRMYQDVEKIIRGPNKTDKKYYLLCALSDLRRMFVVSKKEKQKSKGNDPFFKRFQDNQITEDKIVLRQKVNCYIKKVEYFLSYVASFDINYQ